MIGFTRTVHPTPIAQPVIPNPLPWALMVLGKISVGIKKATVPQVDAYIRLNKNNMVTTAGAMLSAFEGSWREASYREAAFWSQ